MKCALTFQCMWNQYSSCTTAAYTNVACDSASIRDLVIYKYSAEDGDDHCQKIIEYNYYIVVCNNKKSNKIAFPKKKFTSEKY